jgi:uncharacterized protein
VSRPALLDVNVLVALFDPDHVHHELAHDWFADHRTDGWATCATTELGFLRVLAQPVYASPIARPADLVPRLRKFCRGPEYRFWSENISLRDHALFDPAYIQGHRQLTDVYLVGLAVKMRGCLATFDRTIPLRAVTGVSRDTVAVIAA